MFLSLLLAILPCFTALQPAAHRARLPVQHTDVRKRVTPLRAVALPPFDKPVCDMTNVELRKALSLLGVDRLDRMKFWLTGLTGKWFLATRKHELIQAGISRRAISTEPGHFCGRLSAASGKLSIAIRQAW